jgi:colicin import membrane protein
VHLGLIASVVLHCALLAWALLSIQATPPFKLPELTPVEIAIISADDLVQLTKGDRSAKTLEAEGRDGPNNQLPKKEAKLPPPPPAAAAPPPPPPPPEAAKPSEDQIAGLMKELPKPEPAKPSEAEQPKVAPPPDDPLALQKKLEEDARREEEAKAKAAAEAKAKADADRLKKLAEDKKRREEQQKKLAEEKKKREEQQKKSFSNIETVLKGLPDDGPQKALVSQQPKAALPAGAPTTANAPKGPKAGAPEGTHQKLTATEASLLIGAITGKVKQCWNINAGMEGAAQLIPKVEFELNRDGTVRGVPKITNPQSSPQFQDAATSAVRAIVQCQPYSGLPAERYEFWEVVRLTFDPSQMFR